MAQNVFFKKGLLANLPESHVAGTFYVTTDERAMYLDIDDSTRIRLGDFIQVAAVANLPVDGASTTALYYCVEENILAKWDGEDWVQINKQPTAEEMKELLGLDALAYKSKVEEADLDEALKEKVNAAAEGNHSHLNKDELDKIAEGDVEKWGIAYEHSQTDHAPADAQANVIESVKVNGTALEIKDKAVDIMVPTGALADKDEVAKTDLAEALVAEIDGKVKSVAAGDASITIGGSTTEPTVAVKLSAADGNALTLAEDGLKVIATKVEASEVNGNIKVDGEEVTVYTHPDKHVAADIEDFAIEVAKVKVTNAGAADTAAHADAATKVDKALTVKIGGADVVFDGSDEKTVDIDTAIQGAKDYAKGLVDEIPAQIDYAVKVTAREDVEGDDHSAFKHYVFEQCGEEIGHIDIPRDLVVSSGSVGTVTEADVPYAGAVVGDKYIELVIANQDEHLFVPAKDLVDIYTAKDGATEVQVAISNKNEISATLVNKGITEAKLADEVTAKLNKVWEETGVAAGLVEGLANGQVKTNKEAIEAINNETTGILAQAKADASNKDTVILGEAQGYADTAKADAIADAEGKINALAGEGNTSTVKKNAEDIADLYEMLTWGEF